MDKIVCASLALLAVFISLPLLAKWTQNPKEPIVAQSSFPYITPLIRLLRERCHYYVWVRDRYHHQIYTLRLPGTRIYVVNQLPLIKLAQRQIKALSLRPIQARIAAAGICGSNQATFKILMSGSNDAGFSASTHKSMHTFLRPGQTLMSMESIAFSSFLDSIETIVHGKPLTADLFAWTTDVVTLGTTDAVYGDMNPFSLYENRARFWILESNILAFLIGIFPSLFAKQAFQAREALVKSFEAYFTSGGHEKGSDFTKSRFSLALEHGITIKETARLEIAMAVAVLGNTAPAAFWLIYHVYSDPAILATCREEIMRLGGGEKETLMHAIADIKCKCPTLWSALQETLRYHNVGVSARVVMEDYYLEDFLLKRGNTLLMPAMVQHTDTLLWGEEARAFRHRRFLESEIPSGAFRGFGGGSTVCPGRHLASFEIFAFAAILIPRFDIEPCSGLWTMPTTRNAAMWAAIPKPDHDISVIIRRRG